MLLGVSNYSRLLHPSCMRLQRYVYDVRQEEEMLLGVSNYSRHLYKYAINRLFKSLVRKQPLSLFSRSCTLDREIVR